MGGVFGKPALFSFLPFFLFFSYAKVISDELFWDNVRKSALHAFLAQMALSVVTLAAASVPTASDVVAGLFVVGFSLQFAVGLIVFTLNLAHYERLEQRGKAE